MRAVIVFHSVCGNVYTIAKEYKNNLEKMGVEVDLFKVRDDNYNFIAPMFEASRQYKDEIMDIEVINDSHELLKYDLIFFGSPTYFGSVSAQMKAFMDSCCPLWVNAELRGKYFGSFASSGSAYGGSEMCLQSMNIFANHMGMIVLPVPSVIGDGTQCAYGIAHPSGHKSEDRITEQTKTSIGEYISSLPILEKSLCMC